MSRLRMVSEKVEERKNLKQNPMIREWILLISGYSGWAAGNVQDSHTLDSHILGKEGRKSQLHFKYAVERWRDCK